MLFVVIFKSSSTNEDISLQGEYLLAEVFSVTKFNKILKQTCARTSTISNEGLNDGATRCPL